MSIYYKPLGHDQYFFASYATVEDICRVRTNVGLALAVRIESFITNESSNQLIIIFFCLSISIVSLSVLCVTTCGQLTVGKSYTRRNKECTQLNAETK